MLEPHSATQMTEPLRQLFPVHSVDTAAAFRWHRADGFPGQALVVTEGAAYPPEAEGCRPGGADTVYWIRRGNRDVMWRSPATVLLKTSRERYIRMVDHEQFVSTGHTSTYRVMESPVVLCRVTLRNGDSRELPMEAPIQDVGFFRFGRVEGVGMALSGWASVEAMERGDPRVLFFCVDDMHSLPVLSGVSGM